MVSVIARLLTLIYIFQSIILIYGQPPYLPPPCNSTNSPAVFPTDFAIVIDDESIGGMVPANVSTSNSVYQFTYVNINPPTDPNALIGVLFCIYFQPPIKQLFLLEWEQYPGEDSGQWVQQEHYNNLNVTGYFSWTWGLQPQNKPYILTPPDYIDTQYIWIQLNETTCSLQVQLISSCCVNKQPPVLVEQPYWILVLSTLAYFSVSYIWVFCMTKLDSIRCWRRCCLRIRSVPRQVKRSLIRSNESIAEENKDDESPPPPIKPPTLPSELPWTEWRLNEFDENDDGSSFDATEGRVTTQKYHLKSAPSNHDLNTAPILTMSERIARANAGYLFLQLMITTANLLYLIIRFIWLDSSPADSNKSAWWRYQQVYMFWNNSSVVTLLSSAIASYLLIKYSTYLTLLHANQLPTIPRNRCTRRCTACFCCCLCTRRSFRKWRTFYAVEPESKATKKIALAVLTLYSPALITHVIPMWAMFAPWLILAFMICVGLTLGFYYTFTCLPILIIRRRTKSIQTTTNNDSHTNQKQVVLLTSQDQLDEPLLANDSDGPIESIPLHCSIDSSPRRGDTGVVVPITASASPLHFTPDSIDKKTCMNDANSDERLTPALDDSVHTLSIKHPVDDDQISRKAAPSSTPSPAPSSSAISSGAINFLWYEVLLLRMICTVLIVIFFQTCFNYGYIIWTTDGDLFGTDQLNSFNQFVQIIWTDTARTEYFGRNTEQWILGMQASLHQYLMQISLFC